MAAIPCDAGANPARNTMSEKFKSACAATFETLAANPTVGNEWTARMIFKRLINAGFVATEMGCDEALKKLGLM